MRTNPPRMITVVAAVALTLLGLSFTIVPIPFLNDLVAQAGFRPTQQQAFLALLASPLLLTLASFLPNL